jgi:hypothetical protein
MRKRQVLRTHSITGCDTCSERINRRQARIDGARPQQDSRQTTHELEGGGSAQENRGSAS